MERIFEADTRKQVNQKADEWWAKAKGVRFIHRSQTPADFRSNPSKRWVIAINYYKEEASLERHVQTRCAWASHSDETTSDQLGKPAIAEF
jgi:hypothetical protein